VRVHLATLRLVAVPVNTQKCARFTWVVSYGRDGWILHGAANRPKL